jgi:hypothetical protein
MPEFRFAHRVKAGPGEYADAASTGRTRIANNAPYELALARGLATCLRVVLDESDMTLAYAADPGLLHYFRFADATLIPLPPEYPPARHFLVSGRDSASPLTFAPGDAYIALSPGAARVADSPAMARFIHLRDDFNAEKMAESLLAHLAELAGAKALPEDVTVLVVEAR